MRKKILVYYIEDRIFKNIASEKIYQLIKELSESVNGQRLLFISNEELLFLLQKYQRDGFWGIELKFGENNQATRKLISSLNEELNLAINTNSKIDFFNDVEQVFHYTNSIVSKINCKYWVVNENYLNNQYLK